ncbi:M23 family metallopeptidase [Rheinheimera maricola]|uniref:M23 family metallopeptidase n=1 Tax=Rheinheimera maricola TaxID=2793282 RepID=A0ABS7X5Q4_9GAMM|nr:M23 family metallopeptidase [Rheinheimera maricola]MBZ9610864.1 M23 family metallopeptidase [Rheinheimera maricola]
MKVWLKALSLLVSVSCSVSAQPEVYLEGEFTQGGLIRGKAEGASKVFFNDVELPLTADGRFVFGVGRDAPSTHKLTVLENGKTHQRELTFSRRQYDIQHVNGVAQKYVTPAPEVTERIQRDGQNVRSARTTMTRLPYIFDTAVMPAQGRISGVYGSQRVFNGEPRNPHYGLDVAAPVGAAVVAPLNGTVLLAEDLYFSGLTLIIDHGFGVSSTFMHLSKFSVAVGDKVVQGSKIAEVGATGRVTGPHLDWRINWQQERLDPALLPGLNITP